MLQQSQSMRQSPPQKRIPRRVESRPEEAPIMPMGCSQQARKVRVMKKELWFMIIFSLSSKPSTSPNIDLLQIMFRWRVTACDITTNRRGKLKTTISTSKETCLNPCRYWSHCDTSIKISHFQFKPQVTRKDAATSPHINNQMQPSAALMQQRANIMQRQNNQVSQQVEEKEVRKVIEKILLAGSFQ